MRGRGVLATMLALAVPLAMTAVARAGTDTGSAGIVVTSPSPSGFVSYGGVRLQEIGSLGNLPDELVGVADLTTSTDRIEANFTVPRFRANGNDGSTVDDCVGNYQVGSLANPAANRLTMTWDPAGGTLTTRFVNQSLNCGLVFRSFAQELATANGWALAQAQTALADVNALRIIVDDRQIGSKVTLTGATVDGSTAVGPFDPGAGASATWLATGYDFDAPNGFTFAGTVNLGGTFGTCDDTCAVQIVFGHFTPTNRPPVVRDHAADTSGHRGDTLRTGGSFTDPDGDPLSITGSGAGNVIDHGDGTWSWRFVPTADGSDTVTVTASDGNGGTATDRFAWSAVNVPPEVIDHAANTSGSEGDTLTTTGSFADADGDPLSISASGAGTLTDHGDGTWGWKDVPPDDGSGSVTVTASDGQGGTATDTFTWSAGNVPPTIVSLTPNVTTVLAGTEVTWTAVASDPGTGDTFLWSFDGGAPVPGGLTTTFTRTYDACGTYTLDAAITDDDGGSDHAVSDATVTVAEAAVLPPLGAGPRLVQKGQVVPIKIRVGCGDAYRDDLHPAIELGSGDGTSPAESVSAADTPGVMRRDGDGYLYNLRVPRAVGGTELGRGDRITVLVRPFGPEGGALEIELEIRR
jgi:Bacterial Ig domain/PKD domain